MGKVDRPWHWTKVGVIHTFTTRQRSLGESEVAGTSKTRVGTHDEDAFLRVWSEELLLSDVLFPRSIVGFGYRYTPEDGWKMGGRGPLDVYWRRCTHGVCSGRLTGGFTRVTFDDCNTCLSYHQQTLVIQKSTKNSSSSITYVWIRLTTSLSLTPTCRVGEREWETNCPPSGDF